MQIVKLMETNYTHIEKIDSPELFEEVSAYVRGLMSEATCNEALAEQELKEVYIYEIGRLSLLCADYEANYIAPAVLLRKRTVRGIRAFTILLVIILLLAIIGLGMLVLSHMGVLSEKYSDVSGAFIALILQAVCMFMARRQNVKALRKLDAQYPPKTEIVAAAQKS